MSSLVSVIITELLDGYRIGRIQPRKELKMQAKIREAIMIFGLFSLYIGLISAAAKYDFQPMFLLSSTQSSSFCIFNRRFWDIQLQFLNIPF